jgi:hypothetical protein
MRVCFAIPKEGGEEAKLRVRLAKHAPAPLISQMTNILCKPGPKSDNFKFLSLTHDFYIDLASVCSYNTRMDFVSKDDDGFFRPDHDPPAYQRHPTAWHPLGRKGSR